MKKIKLILTAFTFLLPMLVTSMAHAGVGSILTGIATNTALHGGINYGKGNFYSEERNILTRRVNTLEGHLLAGYKIGPLTLGPFGQLMFIEQFRKPEDLLDQNAKGHAYQFGVGSTFSFMDFTLMGSVEFLGKYVASRQAETKQDSEYSKPFGFHAMISRKLMEVMGVGLHANLLYQQTQFKENLEGETTTNLADNKLKMWAIRAGVVVTY